MPPLAAIDREPRSDSKKVSIPRLRDLPQNGRLVITQKLCSYTPIGEPLSKYRQSVNTGIKAFGDNEGSEPPFVKLGYPIVITSYEGSSIVWEISRYTNSLPSSAASAPNCQKLLA